MQYVLICDIRIILNTIDPLINHVLNVDPAFSIMNIWLGFGGYLTAKYEMTGKQLVPNDALLDTSDIEFDMCAHIRDVYFFQMLDIHLLQQTYRTLNTALDGNIGIILSEIFTKKQRIIRVDGEWFEPLVNHQPLLIFTTG